MKRPVRGSGGGSGESPTKLSGRLGSKHSSALLREYQQISQRHASFHLIDGPIEATALLGGTRPAIAAGDLRDERELIRLGSLMEQLAAYAPVDKRASILIAGRNAHKPPRSAIASRLRRSLEDRGAVFIERPADADTAAALVAFLEREYAADPTAVAVGLNPIAPISVLPEHDVTPYLQPRPGTEGDQYFLSHQPQRRP